MLRLSLIRKCLCWDPMSYTLGTLHWSPGMSSLWILKHSIFIIPGQKLWSPVKCCTAVRGGISCQGPTLERYWNGQWNSEAVWRTVCMYFLWSSTLRLQLCPGLACVLAVPSVCLCPAPHMASFLELDILQGKSCLSLGPSLALWTEGSFLVIFISFGTSHSLLDTVLNVLGVFLSPQQRGCNAQAWFHLSLDSCVTLGSHFSLSVSWGCWHCLLKRCEWDEWPNTWLCFTAGLHSR